MSFILFFILYNFSDGSKQHEFDNVACVFVCVYEWRRQTGRLSIYFNKLHLEIFVITFFYIKHSVF